MSLSRQTWPAENGLPETGAPYARFTGEFGERRLRRDDIQISHVRAALSPCIGLACLAIRFRSSNRKPQTQKICL